MKRYLIALLIFAIAFGTASMVYKLLGSFYDEDINSLIHRLVVLVFAVVFMVLFRVGVKQTNDLGNLSLTDFLIVVLILVLFGVNNVFSKELGTEFGYKAMVTLTLIKLTVNSIAEEFMYRGFIQSYINEGQAESRLMISKGNIYSTVLMTLTHIGFYMIMAPIFATTSLILVVLFSLTAGHLREKTDGLLIPILLHLAVNYLHFFIQSNV